MGIEEITQTPNPGAPISLFRLDATSVGGGIMYFCQGAMGGEGVKFGGITYTPIDIQLLDFEMNAGGVLPTPRLQIANSTDIIQGMINEWGDLAGCEIRRVRTFERFLDGKDDEDPTAFIGPEIFRIERLSLDDGDVIEWELSASIDQEGKLLPGRQVLRDTCTFRYRRYDPEHPDAAIDGFVYPTVNPCPYTGSSCFTFADVPTTAEHDECGHRLSSCQARFGEDQPVPFGGFPGAARVRM